MVLFCKYSESLWNDKRHIQNFLFQSSLDKFVFEDKHFFLQLLDFLLKYRMFAYHYSPARRNDYEIPYRHTGF